MSETVSIAISDMNEDLYSQDTEASQSDDASIQSIVSSNTTTQEVLDSDVTSSGLLIPNAKGLALDQCHSASVESAYGTLSPGSAPEFEMQQQELADECREPMELSSPQIYQRCLVRCKHNIHRSKSETNLHRLISSSSESHSVSRPFLSRSLIEINAPTRDIPASDSGKRPLGASPPPSPHCLMNTKVMDTLKRAEAHRQRAAPCPNSQGSGGNVVDSERGSSSDSELSEAGEQGPVMQNARLADRVSFDSEPQPCTLSRSNSEPELSTPCITVELTALSEHEGDVTEHQGRSNSSEHTKRTMSGPRTVQHRKLTLAQLHRIRTTMLLNSTLTASYVTAP